PATPFVARACDTRAQPRERDALQVFETHWTTQHRTQDGLRLNVTLLNHLGHGGVELHCWPEAQHADYESTNEPPPLLRPSWMGTEKEYGDSQESQGKYDAQENNSRTDRHVTVDRDDGTY